MVLSFFFSSPVLCLSFSQLDNGVHSYAPLPHDSIHRKAPTIVGFSLFPLFGETVINIDMRKESIRLIESAVEKGVPMVYRGYEEEEGEGGGDNKRDRRRGRRPIELQRTAIIPPPVLFLFRERNSPKMPKRKTMVCEMNQVNATSFFSLFGKFVPLQIDGESHASSLTTLSFSDTRETHGRPEKKERGRERKSSWYSSFLLFVTSGVCAVLNGAHVGTSTKGGRGRLWKEELVRWIWIPSSSFVFLEQHTRRSVAGSDRTSYGLGSNIFLVGALNWRCLFPCFC